MPVLGNRLFALGLPAPRRGGAACLLLGAAVPGAWLPAPRGACAGGTLLVSPSVILPATGGVVPLPIPADPALAGAEVCAQGLLIDPDGCLRATEAVRITAVY